MCMISWHRFGTITVLFLNDFIYMVPAPCPLYQERKIKIINILFCPAKLESNELFPFF